MAAQPLIQWKPAPGPVRTLLDALAAELQPVYMVGGVVRDALLGRRKPVNDLDLVLAHSALPIARRVADRLGWAFYALDEARDVARVIFTAGAFPIVCDIAGMRGGSIEADLRLRDFTVNALAFAYTRGGQVDVIDVGSGRADLQARLLRRVSPSSLAEDPLRLLRAVRFSVDLGFPIEEETRLQILRMPHAVRLASAERQRDELWKMIAGPDPAAAVELLRTLGILPWVLPEVASTDLVTQSAPHDKDVYRHTLAAVQRATLLRDWLLNRPSTPQADPELAELTTEPMLVARQALESWSYYLRRHFGAEVAAGHLRAEWLVWAALLHDVGKPATRTVERDAQGGERVRFLEHEFEGERMARERLEALRFSRQEIDLCAAVVRSHMRPHHLHDAFAGVEISRRARFRFFRDAGVRALDKPVGIDVLMVAMADWLATNDRRSMADWRAYVGHVAQMLAFVYSEKGVETATLRPLVDGHQIMRELKLEPGPRLGALLEELAEAQAAGEVHTAAEALALARALVGRGDL